MEFLKPIGPASIGLIAFNGLWNFDGWNQLNFVAEEIRDPMKNLPRSILFSMPVVVVVYVLMNVSYLTVLSPQDLYNSESVAVVSNISNLYLYIVWPHLTSLLGCILPRNPYFLPKNNSQMPYPSMLVAGQKMKKITFSDKPP